MSDFFLEDDVELWKFIEIIARSSTQEEEFVHSKGIFQECWRFFNSLKRKRKIPSQSATTRKKRQNRRVKRKVKSGLEEIAPPVEEKVRNLVLSCNQHVLTYSSSNS